MTHFIFTIIILFCLEAILISYIKGVDRIKFLLSTIGALFLCGNFVTNRKAPKQDKKTLHQNKQNSSKVEILSNTDKKKVESSPWVYSEDKDAMGNTTNHFAATISLNNVNFLFPYNTSYAHLIIIRRSKDELNILFTVDSGQILCHSSSRTSFSVKFDDKPIQKILCSSPDDEESSVSFVKSANSFLKQIKNSKKMVIEAPFYQSGNQQFTFNTKDLDFN